MANRKAVSVLYSRDKNGEKIVDAANDYHVVKPEELKGAGNAMEALAMNVMAGRTSASIKKAADNKGLPEVMPGDQFKNQRSALAFLLTIPTEDIQAAWNNYCQNRQRVTPPTLQRLASECKPKKETKPKMDWKGYGEAIIQARESENPELVDKLIHDMAVDAGIPVEPSH